jgi:hypothetical protein
MYIFITGYSANLCFTKDTLSYETIIEVLDEAYRNHYDDMVLTHGHLSIFKTNCIDKLGEIQVEDCDEIKPFIMNWNTDIEPRVILPQTW